MNEYKFRNIICVSRDYRFILECNAIYSRKIMNGACINNLTVPTNALYQNCTNNTNGKVNNYFITYMDLPTPENTLYRTST